MGEDDLDRVNFTSDAASDDTPEPNPTLDVYDPARDREQVRGRLALTLLVLFCFLVAGLAAFTVAGRLPVDALEKIAAVLVAPVTGLLGAVIGFYYGEHASGR